MRNTAIVKEMEREHERRVGLALLLYYCEYSRGKTRYKLKRTGPKNVQVTMVTDLLPKNP